MIEQKGRERDRRDAVAPQDFGERVSLDASCGIENDRAAP